MSFNQAPAKICRIFPKHSQKNHKTFLSWFSAVKEIKNSILLIEKFIFIQMNLFIELNFEFSLLSIVGMGECQLKSRIYIYYLKVFWNFLVLDFFIFHLGSAGIFPPFYKQLYFKILNKLISKLFVANKSSLFCWLFTI